MHNGTIQEADTWLETHLEPYRQWAMSHNSLLIVTWDEDDRKAENHITTIFVGPMVRPGLYAETINHFNVLRTLEDMYGLPAAGKSADATPITNVWTTGVQGPDCNQNGVADGEDIAIGASRDENKDDVPDECQTIRGSIELVQAGPGCVTVMIDSEVAIQGGELGLAYDPQTIVPVGVMSAADLPPSAAVRFDPDPTISCPPETGVAAGFSLGWINSINKDVLTEPGRHALLQICFDLPLGAYRGDSYPLQFVSCLGVAESPVRNVVRDSTGKSLFVAARDGEVSVPGKPIFRRGDANEDGRLDLSDAVVNFHCLFLGDFCAACRDEMDVNDDEKLDITDGIYLLNWRFLAGPEPPPPFPGCGPDETQGNLPVCEQPASCP
jgi:hypothetical protein